MNNTEEQIIKEKSKPNLNGNYCLATKEHYDKLIEDGYVYDLEKLDKFELSNYLYLFVGNGCNDNEFYLSDTVWEDQETPMHLHSNEWVFGSLEHEEEIDECYNPRFDNLEETGMVMEEEYKLKPKPVERITKRDITNILLDYYINGGIASEKAEPIIAYIKYLEANQKGTK